MIVAEHNVGDVPEVNTQLFGIVQHRVGARPGIEQDAMAIGLHYRGKAPLPNPIIGSQHGGEHLNAQRSNLIGRIHLRRQSKAQ